AGLRPKRTKRVRGTTAMPERTTAAEQLSWILYIVPAAARKGGASVDELANALGISRQAVLDAINEVVTRAYYHPAGPGDQFRIRVGHERVAVWTTGEFQRPVRLSPLEALALGLGLRALAAEADGERRAQMLELAAWLERDLPAPDEPAEPKTATDVASAIELMRRKYDPAYQDAEPAPAPAPALALAFAQEGDVLGVLADAARERCRCVVAYLKPGAPAPEMRRIAPYLLLHAEGAWYALAHAAERDALRLFRVDRMLSAELDDERFDAPEDFDPRPWIAPDGR